jgi:metal transporter CNNM
MLPPGKSSSPVISPGAGPQSQGLRRTSMASPLSPYHHGSSVMRSPVWNNVQSPGTLPTILSPGGSPGPQTSVHSSPNTSWVSTHFSISRPSCFMCCYFLFFNLVLLILI